MVARLVAHPTVLFPLLAAPPLAAMLPAFEEVAMLFMVHYEIEPKNRDTSFNRTMALGGDGLPPELKIVGTWSSVTQLEGWVIAEGDDIVAIGKWLRHWTDLNVNRIIPLVDADMQREIMTSEL